MWSIFSLNRTISEENNYEQYSILGDQQRKQEDGKTKSNSKKDNAAFMRII